AANRYLRERPVTVTAARAARSAGGPHDFYSEGDYWWPDPASVDSPYVRRDGETNPANFVAHRDAMRRLSQIVPALVAAYELTGDERYARAASAHLRAWFVSESTRMNPSLLYAQAIKGRFTGRGTGIIDTIHLVEVARAVTVLEALGAIDGATLAGTRDWFRAYLEWMTTHRYGIDERNAGNNHSAAWALQVAEFARLVGDSARRDEMRRFFRETLVPGQMDSTGGFPRELARTKPYGYSLFQLDVMAMLAESLSGPGNDLWTFATPDGRGMRRALAFMFPYIEDRRRWPKPPDVMYDDQWPVRQPALYFGGRALGEARYLALWRRLPADPTVDEVIRNYPVRQPLLWLPPAPRRGGPRAVAANGLAATPPMGWNSWNRFHCDIDERLIREMADAMVASGMRDAGYVYLNIDDCWEAPSRDASGNLAVDSTRFPGGMKALADYVHARGLKLGIYSSAGTLTCQKRPASLDHEAADARTFAAWGIDYLKYDNCNNENRPAVQRYTAMGDAIRATGRPMVYSLCEWGQNRPWEWGRAAGAQLWRTTGDISDRWASVMRLLDRQVGLERYSGPNAWNDPDMLEVGNGRMTDDEYVAHFSLWALLNAPLIAGNDLRTMSEGTKRILMNREVIAVNQDWGGTQGSKLRDDGQQEVWMKPMSDGARAVVLLNRDTAAVSIAVTTAELGLGAGPHVARDLWARREGVVRGTLRATVPGHGAAMYLVRR
ncbi:MAG TPA: alginate lyase family protein, partial [Gemmatimonadaceae bacterium]